MPRLLPWMSGSRTQVKKPPNPRVGTKVPSDIDDDDFFKGTVLASSSNGKGKAIRNDDDFDDNLPELPAESSESRTKSRSKDSFRKASAPSSSPPPIADFIQPQIEYMRKGTTKFDLCDDEWMMVEDEFLETAKLFTRHLHIAEYDKLKEEIEAKKKEQAQANRPVVPGSKMSVEGAMKKKAEVQEKRQQKAIRGVFASQNGEDDESDRATTTAERPIVPTISHESDSDDLDASRPVSKKPIPRSVPVKPTSAPGLSSSHQPAPKPVLPAPASPPFAKPALPTMKPRTTSRKNRATPFEMLDDYIPPAKRHEPASSPARPATAPTPKKVEVKEEWGSGLSKETAQRLAKRKAEREAREEKGKGKKRGVGLEDIPTFLV